MAISLINVFPPNAFVVLSTVGVGYDLLSANVSTGVVTSAYLPASSTDFLTLRLQKLLTLMPSLTAAALKTLIRNLVMLDQLEGNFTVTVTAAGNDYALGLSDLATPSNLQVSIPFSMISPFAVNGPLPSAESLGVTAGLMGSPEDDYRTWGLQFKASANSNAVTNFAMTAAASTLGESARPPDATSTRAWNNYQASGTVTNYAGREGANNDCYWLSRPRLMTLIQSVSAVTNRRIWVSLSFSFLNTVQSDANVRYIGLRYDSTIGPNWYLCTSTGLGSASEVDTGIPLVADTDVAIDLDFTDPAAVVASINGVATTKTTDLPSGAFNVRHSILVTNMSTGAVRDILWCWTMLSRR